MLKLLLENSLKTCVKSWSGKFFEICAKTYVVEVAKTYSVEVAETYAVEATGISAETYEWNLENEVGFSQNGLWRCDKMKTK